MCQLNDDVSHSSFIVQVHERYTSLSEGKWIKLSLLFIAQVNDMDTSLFRD